ncbi:hypothetical protein R6Q57_020288, partial [Mikania cordata]
MSHVQYVTNCAWNLLEAPVNFLTDPFDGRSNLRPVNILVFGWEGGNTCVWCWDEDTGFV